MSASSKVVGKAYPSHEINILLTMLSVPHSEKRADNPSINDKVLEPPRIFLSIVTNTVLQGITDY